MKGLDVICPGCKRSYHSTTEHFSPYKPANGAMVRLKEPWRGYGWCSFGDGYDGRPPDIAERSGTYWSQMDCPGCGAPMAPSGKLTVQHPDGSEFIPGPEPVPVDNTVDGQLVFGTDYSELDAEWEQRQAPVETRDEKVLRLRSDGMTYAAIGKQVGLSAEMVRRIVKKATSKQEAEDVS